MISLDNLKTTLNAIKCLLNDYVKKKDIPTNLPNPNPLIFTGAATGSYDGSEALTVEIPSGGGGGGTGADGKSAYQYAVESGYTGTETEFAEKLASGALTVHVTDNNGTLSADKTYSDILNAIHAGISVFVEYNGNTFPLMGLLGDALIFGFTESINDGSTFMIDTVMILITQDNEVYNSSAALEALPNPNAITFTGAVTGSYDGSAAMTVNIPSAVTDDHINSLIDTKLGVIENGSY